MSSEADDLAALLGEGLDEDDDELVVVDLELSLRPRKARVFQGESIDVELEARNPAEEGRRSYLALEPGNDMVKWILREASGDERGPVGDEEAAAARGRPFDVVDHEGREEILSAGEARLEVFDLLPRAGELTPGAWAITAELVHELVELEAAVEVTPPPAIEAAGGTWDYDRGLDTLGLCAWSTSEGPHAGTYLRVRAQQDASLTLANRRISEHVASPESGLRVARASRYPAQRRHVLWREGELLRVAAVEDELPAGEHELPAAGFLEAWTGNGGELLLARREGDQLVLERRLGGRERPDAALQLLPLPEGARLAGWAGCFGTLWLAVGAPGALHLIGVRVGEGDLSLLGRHERAAAGEPRWLEVRRGPEDDEGEQAAVFALYEGAPATLTRWIPVGEEPVDEQLAEGALPAGRLHDAHLARRLHLLLEREGKLTHATFPGTSAALDARFSPAWSQLVRLSAKSGGELLVRGAEAGRFQFEALQGD